MEGRHEDEKWKQRESETRPRNGIGGERRRGDKDEELDCTRQEQGQEGKRQTRCSVRTKTETERAGRMETRRGSTSHLVANC